MTAIVTAAGPAVAWTVFGIAQYDALRATTAPTVVNLALPEAVAQ